MTWPADTASLIDDLGLGSVHVVGASMGGMIGQILAIEHPNRVRSLTSIMSTTGDRSVGRSTEEALAHLTQPAASTREEVIDRRLQSQANHRIAGLSDQRSRTSRSGRAGVRPKFRPGRRTRQFAAAFASPDRTAGLAELHMPSLVIHGADDPLIQVSGGHATAAAIPGAELLVIDGMGHDLPRQLWPQVIERISTHIARAEGRPDPS